MKLGNIEIKEDSKIPMLEILEQGASSGKLYVMPFKGYRFQVTSKDGTGDYGSSDVLGLGNIVLMCNNYQRPDDNYSIWASNSSHGKGYAKSLFHSMVRESLCEFSARNSYNYVVDYADEGKIEELVEATYNWIHSIITERIPSGKA